MKKCLLILALVICTISVCDLAFVPQVPDAPVQQATVVEKIADKPSEEARIRIWYPGKNFIHFMRNRRR